MATKTCSEVLVSLSTPILSRAARRSFPAATTLGDCVKEVARLATTDPDERRVVQQLRREVNGAQFDILVIFESGKTERMKPETPLGEVAMQRQLLTPKGLEEVWTAQVEVQAYTPVGGRP
jgi:hypothetical protein